MIGRGYGNRLSGGICVVDLVDGVSVARGGS